MIVLCKNFPGRYPNLRSHENKIPKSANSLGVPNKNASAADTKDIFFLNVISINVTHFLVHGVFIHLVTDEEIKCSKNSPSIDTLYSEGMCVCICRLRRIYLRVLILSV